MSHLPSSKSAIEQAKLKPLKGSPKLIISETVSKQITKLCQKYPNVEWSGVMYHTVTGNYTDPDNFIMTAEYILLMDVGSSAYTEYSFSDPSFAEALSEKPELMEMKMGHIHSHNTMGVFFSGTDSDELMDNAVNYNYYLSLIVNNFGKMVARIAIIATITGSESSVSFVDIEGNSIIQTIPGKPEEKVTFYYDCDITVNGVEYNDSFFDMRMEVISAKTRIINPPVVGYGYGRTFPSHITANTVKDEKKTDDKKKKIKAGAFKKNLDEACEANVQLIGSVLGTQFVVNEFTGQADFNTTINFMKFWLRPIVVAIEDTTFDKVNVLISNTLINSFEPFLSTDALEIMFIEIVKQKRSLESTITDFTSFCNEFDNRANTIAILKGLIDYINNTITVEKRSLSALNSIIAEEGETYGLELVLRNGKFNLYSSEEIMANEIEDSYTPMGM